MITLSFDSTDEPTVHGCKAGRIAFKFLTAEIAQDFLSIKPASISKVRVFVGGSFSSGAIFAVEMLL